MRRRSAPTSESGGVLPLELTGYAGSSASDFRRYCRQRRRWLLDHGIDPADLTSVRALQSASEAAHGLPDSSAQARARRRAESRSTP